jgi:hypothetical protein
MVHPDLETNFKSRFSDLALSQHEWIQKPFSVKTGDKISHLSITSQESLVELACDTALKINFEALPLTDIYIRKNMLNSQLAIDVLLLSGSTYPCETVLQQLNRSTVTGFRLKVAY